VGNPGNRIPNKGTGSGSWAFYIETKEIDAKKFKKETAHSYTALWEISDQVRCSYTATILIKNLQSV